MRILSNFIKIIAGLIVGTVLGLIVFLFAGQLIFSNFFKPFVVLSGSMEPAIKVGSVVLVQPQRSYGIGDVITFNTEGKEIITHRVTGISYPTGETSKPEFETKGDGNEEADTQKVQISKVVGKSIVSVPYLGYLVEFAKVPQGFILFVIIPATIIVYEELKSIKKELRRLFGRKGVQTHVPNDISEIINQFPQITSVLDPLPKPAYNYAPAKHSKARMWAVLIPVAGTIFVLTAVTTAYFFDQETSNQNVLGVATTYSPTPTPFTPITTFSLLADSPSTEPAASPTPAGSPTSVAVTTDHLVINEIYYQPDKIHSINDSNSESQWIEIYNPTASAVSLSGWSIRDNADCDDIQSQVVLEPSKFVIISRATKGTFEDYWDMPLDTQFITLSGSLGDGLSNSDELTLRSTSCTQSPSVTVDQVSWGVNTNGFNPPLATTADGSSSERNPDGTDSNTKNDFVTQTAPTPGS